MPRAVVGPRDRGRGADGGEALDLDQRDVAHGGDAPLAVEPLLLDRLRVIEDRGAGLDPGPLRDLLGGHGQDLVGALAQLAEVARHEADDGAEGAETALEGTRRVELLVEPLGVPVVLPVDEARALVARQ